MGMKRQRTSSSESSAPTKKAKRAPSSITSVTPLNAVQKAQIAKIISRREEVKFIDAIMNSTSITSTAVTSAISAPSQAVGQQSRVGDSIRLLSISCKQGIICSDTTNFLRVIIWTYKQSTSLAAATTATILSPGPGGAISVFSPLNFANRKLYKIHYDKIYSLSLNGPACCDDEYRVNIPPKYQQVDFDAAAQTGTNIVHITYLSDSNAVSHPTMQGTWRTFFNDA